MKSAMKPDMVLVVLEGSATVPIFLRGEKGEASRKWKGWDRTGEIGRKSRREKRRQRLVGTIEQDSIIECRNRHNVADDSRTNQEQPREQSSFSLSESFFLLVLLVRSTNFFPFQPFLSRRSGRVMVLSLVLSLTLLKYSLRCVLLWSGGRRCGEGRKRRARTRFQFTANF